MDTRANRWRVPGVAGLVLLVAAVAAGVIMSSPSGGSGDAATTAPAIGAPVPPPAADPALTVSVKDRAAGRSIAPGFLGFSFEFPAVRAYTGSDPRHIDPVLVQLIRNLTPGQAPVIRIGGDSTDISYVPVAGVRLPASVDYPLTASWLATTGALAHQLGARMIMGLNLAANEPKLAGAEAGAFERALGGSLTALEIGNEPNVYGKTNVYRAAFGIPVPARPSDYAFPAYRRQFAAIAAAAPGPRLAGPALAIGPTPGRGSWAGSIPGFLAHERRVSIMTVHRYPLRNCDVPPASPQYPSIAHLLSSYATTNLAASLRRWVSIAHGQHRLLRVDELNSVACRGKTGVSDTFASALWVTDALFSLARVGVNGVDMHTLPDSAYELFQFRQAGGRWQGTVRPVYYGLQLFAEAAPAGSRLLTVSSRGRAPGVSVWATRARDGTVRVVAINENQTRDETVRIRVPGSRAATVQRMLAPSASAGTGITLGGASYGAETTTGVLPAPHDTRVAAHRRGTLTVSVPHTSAALLTVSGGR